MSVYISHGGSVAHRSKSWRGGSSPPCHGRGALEQGTVPPCSSGAVIGCPPLQRIWHLSLCRCVFARCQPGRVKRGGVISCISCINMTINLISICISFLEVTTITWGWSIYCLLSRSGYLCVFLSGFSFLPFPWPFSSVPSCLVISSTPSTCVHLSSAALIH